MVDLTYQEILRYNRQISLQGFDFDKQEKLKSAKAIIVGLGGLGCAASQYLAAAGIGQMTLIDFDVVSLSNLHRQILYTEKDLGCPKVDIAKNALHHINTHVDIVAIQQSIEEPSIENSHFATLLDTHDIVLDCTDNITARNQLNQFCFTHKKPLVSGAAIRMEGMITIFTYQKQQPCYHCLSRFFGEQQLTCVESGVMSPLVGIIGAMQAMEGIKVLTQFGQPLSGKLILLDALTMQFKEIFFTQQPDCPVCGKHES